MCPRGSLAASGPAQHLHGLVRGNAPLGQVVQNISTGDGQYTLQGDPPLTRSGLVAQPFDNNYRLGYLSATRSIGDMKAALELHPFLAEKQLFPELAEEITRT